MVTIPRKPCVPRMCLLTPRLPVAINRDNSCADILDSRLGRGVWTRRRSYLRGARIRKRTRRRASHIQG